MTTTYTTTVATKMAWGWAPLLFGLPFARPMCLSRSAPLAAAASSPLPKIMAHYLIAHLNGGRYGEAQSSQAPASEMHSGSRQQRVMDAR